MKRLILFASYDIQGIVSNALVRYIRALSRIGDIVYFADCEMQEKELDKLIPYTLSRGAQRHREYDFGSYKRAWEWAESHLDINSYDCVYLLNDSVYWTGLSLEWLFRTIEALDKDAYGVNYDRLWWEDRFLERFYSITGYVRTADLYGLDKALTKKEVRILKELEVRNTGNYDVYSEEKN